MKTDRLFHPKGANPYFDNTPTPSYRLDKHDNNERELSPWSSEENRFLKPQQQMCKAKLDNSSLKPLKKRYQEKVQLDPAIKDRSLQLKPLKTTQLSVQLFRLVRRQKRKVASKDQSQSIPLSMHKVEMNLHINQSQEDSSLKEISSTNKRAHLLIKEQPTRVKLAKKLRSISIKDNKGEEPPGLFHPNNPFQAIPHQQQTRMTERSTKRHKKLHHFQQGLGVPMLGLYTITGKTLQGEEELCCRGDPIKNQLRSSRKYRLVNEISEEMSFLQRL